MSDLEEAEALVTTWLEALPDASAPCGADLEYDNEFLALAQAAAGKPESQFGPAEPADWRRVVQISASLFQRTRDLRVAVDWLRGGLRLWGYGALPIGLRLVNGLVASQWDHLHPLPDPDDGDPYGRVNALTLLREPAGLLGELRETRLVEDRAIGLLVVREVEAALGLPTVGAKSEVTREQAARMLEAALVNTPTLRAICQAAVEQVDRLATLSTEKLGSGAAPDFRPLRAIVVGVAGLLPAEAASSDDDGPAAAGEATSAGAPGAKAARGISGSVTTREEAVKAIDLVIDYLERAEPTNPAPLFLRRARQLVNHNFLQLMKVLAPDALSEVARLVGVDPDTVEDPSQSS
jgi:type VI secretion system protein ImpA